jgi:succinate dehydrogenase flavin-adding protein (antitoxin of CptAB toxin-antitoxin module)
LELCNGLDDDCDGNEVGCVYLDADGDGYSTVLDCDDADVDNFPFNQEVCDDEQDNNCNGAVDFDDGDCSGYADNDLDGYAEIDGDCNDANPDIYPDAPELSDGLDNDCDGFADEGTDTHDDDGDLFAEIDGDCNDSNVLVHPEAIEECDFIDNDCDGRVDEGCLYLDEDQDGYSSILDCNDADLQVNPAATEVCGDGLDNDCDGSDALCEQPPQEQDTGLPTDTGGTSGDTGGVPQDTADTGVPSDTSPSPDTSVVDTVVDTGGGGGGDTGIPQDTSVPPDTADTGAIDTGGPPADTGVPPDTSPPPDTSVVDSAVDTGGGGGGDTSLPLDTGVPPDTSPPPDTSVVDSAVDTGGGGGGDTSLPLDTGVPPDTSPPPVVDTGGGGGGAVDADGDGFDATVDCNDANALLNPAATEVCGDGLDQDCTGADLACAETLVTTSWLPNVSVAGVAPELSWRAGSTADEASTQLWTSDGCTCFSGTNCVCTVSVRAGITLLYNAYDGFNTWGCTSTSTDEANDTLVGTWSTNSSAPDWTASIGIYRKVPLTADGCEGQVTVTSP